jgi:hypothetical protein
VVCNSTIVAQVLCSIIFKSGTWSTHNSARDVTFHISRRGHTITTGTASLRDGRVTVRSRRLPPGRYLLTITIGRGSHQRRLVRQAVIITAAGRVTTTARSA